MKITIEMVDGFLLATGTGEASSARVARVRWQPAPRKPYRTANIIVETEMASVIVSAVAAYLQAQGA